MNRSILRKGANCARIERAERLSYIVDAADYFRAFVESVARARSSLYIVGWDLHGGTRLLREDDGKTLTLRPFLREALRRNEGLEAYLLCWGAGPIFWLERERFPKWRWSWRMPKRLRFHMDKPGPWFASHHQKIIAIDELVAFTGGLDLTIKRWDTPRHEVHDQRRRDPRGRHFRPFHDVQAAVFGPCAKALADIARDRWEQATGERLPTGGGKARESRKAEDLWPPSLSVDLTDVDIGISLTDPAGFSSKGRREIEALYVDAISVADRSIYIENQFVTSERIGEALARKLAQPFGPEVVIVSPYKRSSPLEDWTLGVLQRRLHRRLREADHFGRLRLYYPSLPGQSDGNYLNVHSKVMVVDDDVAVFGSANLTNRSMAVDTECNLTLESLGRQRVRATIASLRDRLLAEHLGLQTSCVAAAVKDAGSLGRAIDSFSTRERHLGELRITADQRFAETLPVALTLADPPRPLRPDWRRLVVAAIRWLLRLPRLVFPPRLRLGDRPRSNP